MERRKGLFRLARSAAARLVGPHLDRPPVAPLSCVPSRSPPGAAISSTSAYVTYQPSPCALDGGAVRDSSDTRDARATTASHSPSEEALRRSVVASREISASQTPLPFAKTRGAGLSFAGTVAVARLTRLGAERAVDGGGGSRFSHSRATRRRVASVPTTPCNEAPSPASHETRQTSSAACDDPIASHDPSPDADATTSHDPQSSYTTIVSIDKVPTDLLDLFRGWGMDDREVRRVLRSRPGLARSGMAEKILPGVRVLFACGVPPRDMALGALYDSVWLGQPAEKIKEVVRYLNGLGLADGESIGMVLRRFPRAFAFDVTTQLQPRVQKLLNMGIKDTSYIIKACPRLLQLSSERVQERLDFLAQVAGEGHVSAIVQRQPYILTQPISELQSKLDAFQSILGSETLARKIFRQIRRLPAHSASTMISTFHTLCTIVGGPENAQQVVEKRSSILSTNSTTMLSNFNHWRALLPQLSPPELSHLFVRYPALLHLSWKSNIAPKAEFFRRELGLSEAAVVAVPLVACYSLEQRIRPRIQRVRDAGVRVVERGGGIVCLPRCVVDGERGGCGDGGRGASEEERIGGGSRGDDVCEGKGGAGAGHIGRKTEDSLSGVGEEDREGLGAMAQLPVAIAVSLAGGVALLLRRRGRRKRDDAIRESAEEVAEAGEGGEGEGGEGEYGDPAEDDEELAEGGAGDEAEMGEEGDAGEAAEAAAGLKLLREEFEAAMFDGKEFDIDWDEFPYHISNHAKEHLLASFFVHLKRTRLAKFVACFPNLSNWILLSGPHGSEVYQDTLVRAIARKLNARLIAVDADKFLSPADMSSVPKRRPAADKPRDSLDSAGLSDSLDSPLVSSSPLGAPLSAPPLPPSLATSRPLPLPSLPCPSLPCPSLPCPSLPCPSLPCPSLPCPSLPCPSLPCPSLPCPSLPCPSLRRPSLHPSLVPPWTLPVPPFPALARPSTPAPPHPFFRSIPLVLLCLVLVSLFSRPFFVAPSAHPIHTLSTRVAPSLLPCSKASVSPLPLSITPPAFHHPSRPSITPPALPSPLPPFHHPSRPSITPPALPSPLPPFHHPSRPSITPPALPSPLPPSSAVCEFGEASGGDGSNDGRRGGCGVCNF
ncbi:unnamed protein product [Closterium sp. Naga37s-1]|nr:unnamed protein product [Closterium sp. Naga37s-1]